jgi:hypothetical protein
MPFAGAQPLECRGALGFGPAVAGPERLPGGARLGAACAERLGEALFDAVGDQEVRVLRPAVGPLGQPHLFLAQRLAVRGGGVGLVRRAIADDAPDADQRRPIRSRLEPLDRAGHRRAVVGVFDAERTPAVALEAFGHVLGERDVGVAFDRDGVVVVDPAEVGELEMAGDRGRLARHTLHHVAVRADGVDVVVEKLELRRVEPGRQPALGDRHADRVAAALAEWTGGDLDPGRMAVFRVARTDAAQLPKALDVVEADGRLAELVALPIQPLDAGEEQQGIEQHAGVAVRQQEAVAVRPVRLRRIVFEEARPQRVGDRRQPHRRAGMP